ncbi:MAG: aminotransferase class I and II [Gammaproteobacteria bacterium]|nr:MAG: aminotransferase class I and II [Gammaproteobacteria bacterium]
MPPRTVTATRYVTPLREGGSLPAIVEADDQGLYVLKFRGAGQGVRALIAELVAGEIARTLGLSVPEIVLVELAAELARTEPDPEIQHLIRASAGVNLALDYLPGSVTFDPLADRAVLDQPEPDLASRIVWFDAYVSNVDRSARNTNLLVWHRRLRLIDHGAALYFHHAWGGASPADIRARALLPFKQIKDHVLLPYANRLAEIDAAMAEKLDAARIAQIVASIPDAWLADADAFSDATTHRAAYVDYLTHRLQAPRAFVAEAIHAQHL